jgi:hypothetical protein
MRATMKGCEIVLSKPMGSGVFSYASEASDGGDEEMSRNPAHCREHLLTERFLA